MNGAYFCEYSAGRLILQGPSVMRVFFFSSTYCSLMVMGTMNLSQSVLQVKNLDLDANELYISMFLFKHSDVML